VEEKRKKLKDHFEAKAKMTDKKGQNLL